MKYKLDFESQSKKLSLKSNLSEFILFIKGIEAKLLLAFVFIILSSVVSVAAPFLIGDIIDKYLPTGDKENLLKWSGVILVVYIFGATSSFLQIFIMGRVGQEVLYRLRKNLFEKVQSLPLQFFNDNKSGDLISRINNDTDKLAQALSETVLRFLGNVFVIIGISAAMLILNIKLGGIALGVVVTLIFFTTLTSRWVRNRNKISLQKNGEMSGEVQESLSNFKIVVAFNKREYFKNQFEVVNENNRKAATLATIANGVVRPVFNFGSKVAVMFIVVFGIQILIFDSIEAGNLPLIGLLSSYLLYTNSLFNSMEVMASLYPSIQTSIAAWVRVRTILSLDTNMPIIAQSNSRNYESRNVIEFDNVSFGYEENQNVLSNINFTIETGKTYALVGPTGGGKSTIAALISRLYDPLEGQVKLFGDNIKSYTHEELSKITGFILQEPFLFSGTLKDNIIYANPQYKDISTEEMFEELKSKGLERVIERFVDGLDTKISNNADNISLGQKQLIAFVRILLRSPKLLILDEATANIDTLTEEILEDIIGKLPKETSKIIIAHRLNTIKTADQIIFVAGGKVEKAQDYKSAIALIQNSKRVS